MFLSSRHKSSGCKAVTGKYRGRAMFSPLVELLETRRLLSGSSLASNQLLTSYGQLPLSFEPNLGQAPARVQFLTRSGGFGVSLTAAEAVLSEPTPASPSDQLSMQ